jgi:hypothetical protein
VIVLDEIPTETGAGGGAAYGRAWELEGAWREDVALEMWIDVGADPVRIRLAGVLDESTGANLLDVIDDCVAEGRLHFALDTGALRLEASGRRVIDRLRDRVDGAGGRLEWDRSVPV